MTFFSDIRIHNYNKLIALSFSYCLSSKCNDDNDDYSNGLLILGYPNGTDKNFYLYEYLLDNINSTINYIDINLENEIRIENNIFGYIFYDIFIMRLINCDYLNFISTTNNKKIIPNYNYKKMKK